MGGTSFQRSFSKAVAIEAFPFQGKKQSALGVPDLAAVQQQAPNQRFRAALLQPYPGYNFIYLR